MKPLLAFQLLQEDRSTLQAIPCIQQAGPRHPKLPPIFGSTWAGRPAAKEQATFGAPKAQAQAAQADVKASASSAAKGQAKAKGLAKAKGVRPEELLCKNGRPICFLPGGVGLQELRTRYYLLDATAERERENNKCSVCFKRSGGALSSFGNLMELSWHSGFCTPKALHPDGPKLRQSRDRAKWRSGLPGLFDSPLVR